jgi:hypothetical protein
MTYKDPFQVGDFWPDALIPKEKTGNFYLYREGNHLLVLCQPDLSRSHIQAVQRNRIELALVVREQILFLCHHFYGFSPWEDIPYNWHLPGNEQVLRYPPLVAPGEFLPLLVVLVEATTSRIVARRGLRLPPGFSKVLHDALRVQALAPFNLMEFDQRRERLRQEFPTAKELTALAQAACVIEAKPEQNDRRN